MSEQRAGPGGADDDNDADADADADFAAYYNARAQRLRTTAYLLCGDWHLAQDLVQMTFTKLYRVWRRVERQNSIDHYAHRVLLRAYLDERRRPWRREVSAEILDAALTTPEPAAAEGHSPDDRLILRAALSALPRRQRAVLVLRFWADLPVEQVAALMNCSTGTVKSQTSDGLANVRRVLGSNLDDLRPNRSSSAGSAGRHSSAEGSGPAGRVDFRAGGLSSAIGGQQ